MFFEKLNKKEQDLFNSVVNAKDGSEARESFLASIVIKYGVDFARDILKELKEVSSKNNISSDFGEETSMLKNLLHAVASSERKTK